MTQEYVPQCGDSAPGLEYPTALAAVEDRQIFAITPILGGFELREKGRDEYFVRLLPEQLRELGEEIIAMAISAMLEPSKAAEAVPAAPPRAEEPTSPATKAHTISIPSGIWDARLTQEFQARIAHLEKVESPQKPITPQQIRPWIKP
jgi:hypothetical protein